MFSFDNAFELHNDIEVLKKMGLDCGLHSGTPTEEEVKRAKAMLPKAFESTLDGEYDLCIVIQVKPSFWYSTFRLVIFNYGCISKILQLLVCCVCRYCVQ